MATVILGGLASSTVLDLLVRPGMLLATGRRPALAHAVRHEPPDRTEEALAEALGPSAVAAPPESPRRSPPDCPEAPGSADRT